MEIPPEKLPAPVVNPDLGRYLSEFALKLGLEEGQQRILLRTYSMGWRNIRHDLFSGFNSEKGPRLGSAAAL
jgi:hypothetical protein